MTRVKIIDMLGREVTTLVDKEMRAGILHRVTFDASKLSSGIYFSILESGGEKQMRRLVLLK